MSFYKKVPEIINKVVNKASKELSQKCKPCLIIKGENPDEMYLVKKYIMDSYWTTINSEKIMTKVAEYSYYKGLLDGIEKSKSKEVESVKASAYEIIIKTEDQVNNPDD